MMRAEEYSFFKNGLGLTQRAVKIVLGNLLVTTILMCVSLLPSNSLFFFFSLFSLLFSDVIAEHSGVDSIVYVSEFKSEAKERKVRRLAARNREQPDFTLLSISLKYSVTISTLTSTITHLAYLLSLF